LGQKDGIIVSRRQKIMLAVIFIAMFNFLLVILFGDKGLVELQRLGRVYQQLSKGNERLTRENSQMYRSVDRLQNDPAFVENIARQELGMIRPDELIFKFKNKATNP
jgi:cell division protein FtsB